VYREIQILVGIKLILVPLRFHEKEDKLHILVNNAGLVGCPDAKTQDGFEMTMGVNHLGHFLLTHMLLDLLNSSAPSRVVNVTSSAYYFSKIERDDFQSGKKVTSFIAYSKSKLANILFTRHLARVLKGTGVTVNCCHPGRIKKIKIFSTF
jgi:NAD(P)-dependent dehydrogenase (short-subunit alcohol dehydrogenase family)